MNLRPTRLHDIIGQTNIKKRLNISIKACQTLNEPLPHLLFYGPSGTGKTTFAQAIANELNYPIEIGNGANIQSIKSLLPYLMRLKENSILFIDELHRLPIKVAELLYVCIEEFRVDIGNKDSVSIDLPKFTFIGATTNSGLIPKPLYDRFVLKFPLSLYSVSELEEIITANAKKSGVLLSPEAVNTIATSSRHTPRIANNRLKWIRHYGVSHGINIIKNQDILNALSLEGVNKDGIDNNDIKYLSVLKQHQPAGINTLSSLTNISRDTIEEVIEPFLLKLNKIKKTQKGRMLC